MSASRKCYITRPGRTDPTARADPPPTGYRVRAQGEHRRKRGKDGKEGRTSPRPRLTNQNSGLPIGRTDPDSGPPSENSITICTCSPIHPAALRPYPKAHPRTYPSMPRPHTKQAEGQNRRAEEAKGRKGENREGGGTRVRVGATAQGALNPLSPAPIKKETGRNIWTPKPAKQRSHKTKLRKENREGGKKEGGGRGRREGGRARREPAIPPDEANGDIVPSTPHTHPSRASLCRRGRARMRYRVGAPPDKRIARHFFWEGRCLRPACHVRG